MPFPRHRSTSAKQRTRRTPLGRVSTTYSRKKGSKNVCAICRTILHSVMVRSKKLKRASKTQKRPERKFAGVLCGGCVEQIVKEKTRIETGAISREDVPLSHLKYFSK
ncbi:MAG: 50S ribosomal protein L34e [Candidatus Micrarchaeota archaeon]